MAEVRYDVAMSWSKGCGGGAAGHSEMHCSRNLAVEFLRRAARNC